MIFKSKFIIVIPNTGGHDGCTYLNEHESLSHFYSQAKLFDSEIGAKMYIHDNNVLQTMRTEIHELPPIDIDAMVNS